MSESRSESYKAAGVDARFPRRAENFTGCTAHSIQRRKRKSRDSLPCTCGTSTCCAAIERPPVKNCPTPCAAKCSDWNATRRSFPISAPMRSSGWSSWKCVWHSWTRKSSSARNNGGHSTIKGGTPTVKITAHSSPSRSTVRAPPCGHCERSGVCADRLLPAFPK